MKTKALPLVVVAILLGAVAPAFAKSADGIAVIRAAEKHYANKHAEDRARWLHNWAVLLKQVATTPTVEFPESQTGELDRLLTNADTVASEKVVELVKVVVGRLVSRTAGTIVGGLLVATSTSPCADLPVCGTRMKRDCVVRFIADTEPAQFERFVKRDQCAQNMRDALL